MNDSTIQKLMLMKIYFFVCGIIQFHKWLLTVTEIIKNCTTSCVHKYEIIAMENNKTHSYMTTYNILHTHINTELPKSTLTDKQFHF